LDSRRPAARTQQIRQRIAQEAARIMSHSGSRNFLQAKRKAAQALGVSDARHMPANWEVEQALAAYQRLFLGDSQPDRLRELRRTALQAMHTFRAFSPRLVGPVLEGTADQHSEVNLHLFAEAVEEVGTFLLDRRIPWVLSDRRLRLAGGEHERCPEYRFVAGEVPMALTVFSGVGRRQVPLSPVDGRPMRRAGIAELEALLAAPVADRPD
jgi:hypothetical protein